MDFAQLSRNISQRYSISSLIAFGVLLVLTIVLLHQDSRIGKIEEKSKTNRFISKKSLDDKPDDTPRPGVGSLYTRWGRTTCPPHSKLVYEGVASGEWWDHSGGGSNLLCLPNDPIWANYTTKVEEGGLIYGRPGVGSLYTRWGRTTCPPHSKLVYEGVAGGQLFQHTGGGSNLLCLPNDPIWANYTTGVEDGGFIYGSEYQIDLYPTNKLFSFANAKSLYDHNVPCAVCLTRQPAVVMMLPARTECYPGWLTEYSGYLMTEAHYHKGRHEYVCVDHAPEADPAGYRNENGALLYFIQAICGSLPCPPYVNGQELTCVVCSKY